MVCVFIAKRKFGAFFGPVTHVRYPLISILDRHKLAIIARQMTRTGNTVQGFNPSKASTPKKGQPLTNGHMNGTGSGRKKVAHMDSEDEGTSAMSNGVINGHSNISHPSPSKKRKLVDKQSALQEQRRQLPIYQGQYLNKCPIPINIDRATGRESLIEEFRKNDVTVLLGETGSGKTTRKFMNSTS